MKNTNTVPKLFAGIIPDIFGYGMLVVAESEATCMKLLRKDYRRWKRGLGKLADPTTTFAKSFEEFGGRVLPITIGKVYYENFGE